MIADCYMYVTVSKYLKWTLFSIMVFSIFLFKISYSAFCVSLQKAKNLQLYGICTSD